MNIPDKFKETMFHEQDAEAYCNWGNSLISFAILNTGAAADGLYREACEKFEKAITLDPDYYQA